MSTLSNDTISAAQSGEESAQTEVYTALRPMLRSLAAEFAATSHELEELEAEAALHVFEHLAGYKVGSRAKLSTYLMPRVRQDVRNAHFGGRYAGAINGEAASRYARAAGEVHAEARQERNAGGERVTDAEIHVRIGEKLASLPHGLAWDRDRFLAVHDWTYTGLESLNQESGEDGEELGALMAEAPTPEEETEDRARESRRLKRGLVAELLDGGHISDDQRTVLQMSFGLGLDRDFVPGLLETSGKRMRGQQISAGNRSDVLVAEALGKDVSTDKAVKTACASVRQLRKRALAKLAKVVEERVYPGRDNSLPTQEEALLMSAVTENDEGVYVRTTHGKGGDLVLVKYLNGEGDVVEFLSYPSRLVTLGILEGKPVERRVSTYNYGYHKLYGYGTFTKSADVFDNGATDLTGVPMGVGVLELVERQGEKVLPVAGRDYSLPLWEVSPAGRLEHIRSRAYLAKH